MTSPPRPGTDIQHAENPGGKMLKKIRKIITEQDLEFTFAIRHA